MIKSLCLFLTVYLLLKNKNTNPISILLLKRMAVLEFLTFDLVDILYDDSAIKTKHTHTKILFIEFKEM